MDRDVCTAYLLTSSLYQGMRLACYASPFVSRWSTVIGAFRSVLSWGEAASSAVRCCAVSCWCVFRPLAWLVGCLDEALYMDVICEPVRVSINSKRDSDRSLGRVKKLNGEGLGTGES